MAATEAAGLAVRDDRQGDMTVIRCRTKGCPWPDDYPHTPWCLHIEGVEHWANKPTHQHYPKKGMGGNNPNSKIVAILCEPCHDEVDNGYRWGNGVFPDGDGKRHYLLWDVAKGIENPLIDRVLEAGSAAAEVSLATSKRSLHRMATPSAAAPSASGESSAAEAGLAGQETQVAPVSPSVQVPVPESGSSAAPPSFDLNGWCAEGMQLVYWGIALRDAKDEVRFRIGDWYNRGDGILGEEAYGYLRGFEDVTVRQYSWVAGRVAPDTRVSELPWTYHRAVAALAEPEQKEWLAKAKDGHLSSKELHQAIHGEKPKVKKWSFIELEGHLCHTCRAVVELMEAP